MLTRLLTAPPVFLFCSGKNYTSTFKIRSRLSQFFKHVHPDQLAQAPTKVKQQNLRSLTNFNSYIDSISQAKAVEAKVLKFFIAEKNNLKSKKFFSFSVQLPEISARDADLSQEKAKKLVDNIVEVLNRKFFESRNIKGINKMKQGGQSEKIQGIKVQKLQTQQQRLQKMTSTAKPFNKNNRVSQLQSEMLKSALNTKFMQAQRQTLSNSLRRRISFADTGNNKPMMWSRLATNQSGIYKDYQTIMDELIDPRLIYFDENITREQMEQFKKRILPGAMDLASYKASKIIAEVCAKMQSFDPPICFYISTKYSSTEIPGFLTIPYNFKPLDLAHFFQKQIDTVLAEQQKFQQYFDYERELRHQLKQENNFIIEERPFKNNDDIRSWVLMLKRLQKYRSSQPIVVTVFDRTKYEIFLHGYKVQSESTVTQYKDKLVMVTEFKDHDMQQVINRINQPVGTVAT